MSHKNRIDSDVSTGEEVVKLLNLQPEAWGFPANTVIVAVPDTETQREGRTQLATAREELAHTHELGYQEEMRANRAEARADRLEAALERVREWAERHTWHTERERSMVLKVLSLIEHGPDDGRKQRITRGFQAQQSGSGGVTAFFRPAEPDDGEPK